MENINDQNWVEQLLPVERKDLVYQLFPLKTPPIDVARNCLLISDPELQLKEGFHDTTSSVLLFPREDKRVLVPAITFDGKRPPLNLWVLISDTLPFTYEVTNRKWAVWFGRNMLKRLPVAPLYFTPQKADKLLQTARQAKQIYEQLIAGSRDSRNLKGLMAQFVEGHWLKYCVATLPKRITEHDEPSIMVARKLFLGLEEKVESARELYSKLPPDDKALLENAFRVTVKARFSQPFAYLTKEIDDIRKNEIDDSDNVRDPLEIIGRTQGVSVDDVEAIYIPDDIFSTKIGTIAGEKVRLLGAAEKLKPASQMPSIQHYESCTDRYGKFTTRMLADFIKDGKLTPLIPWKL